MQPPKRASSVLLPAVIIGLVFGSILTYVLINRGSWPMMSVGRGMMGGSVTREGLDRHFIEQMIPHHQDAVGMAKLALMNAEHPELKQLAENIDRDQSREIGEMESWYKEWYGEAVPTYDAGGVGTLGDGMMGGLGTMALTDREGLETAKQFDKEFIEQMIPHHQMAIMMAQMLLSGTSREELRTLGRNIIMSQSAEIAKMRAWYVTWYTN